MSRSALLNSIITAWETMADEAKDTDSDVELDDKEMRVLGRIAEEMKSASTKIKWKKIHLYKHSLDYAREVSKAYNRELTEAEFQAACKFVRELVYHEDGPNRQVVCHIYGNTTSDWKMSIRHPNLSTDEFLVEASVSQRNRPNQLLWMNLELSVRSKDDLFVHKVEEFDEDSQQESLVDEDDERGWDSAAEKCGLGRKCGVFLWKIVVNELQNYEVVFGNLSADQLDDDSDEEDVE